ncbi:MAG TPA: ribonuclease E/G [Novosphingobium sp.]|nr:ribonuclease E/G [Novosphingobium sp.]
MAEWLYEDGIGEERAILVENGDLVAARVEWGEGLRPGLVADARLIAKPAGARRGTARFPDGGEALVDHLPREACEGDSVRLRVTRAAIGETGRMKLAQARPAPGETLAAAPSLLSRLRAGPDSVRIMTAHDDAFAAHGWDELVEQASTGEVAFAGGSLTISPTPAMTLIDVDGTLPPSALALDAVPAIAAALRRLDLGGSVGIDFPTLPDKRERQAVDAALEEALAGWRGERTAMNGFGFVQLVSRLERVSLVARFARKSAAAARILIRRAERVAEAGALELIAHPAVRRAVLPAWEAELARRTGRRIAWREDPGLAPTAAFAQAVPP